MPLRIKRLRYHAYPGDGLVQVSRFESVHVVIREREAKVIAGILRDQKTKR